MTAEFDVTIRRGVYLKPVTNIDPAKIFPSTLQLDYFDLLAKKGSRIGALKAKSDTLTDFQNRLVQLGNDAAEAVHELRYEDNEKFKVEALKKKLPFKILTSPYTIKAFQRTFIRLDIVKTAGAPGVAPGALADRNYVQTDALGKSHAKAI